MSTYVNNSSSSTGVGVFGLLGTLFVALKLMGYIDWSWTWVLAPFWIPVILLAIVFVLLVTIARG